MYLHAVEPSTEDGVLGGRGEQAHVVLDFLYRQRARKRLRRRWRCVRVAFRWEWDWARSDEWIPAFFLQDVGERGAPECPELEVDKRSVFVHRVHDLTDEGPHVERELALVKVVGTGEKRIETLRLADIFRAKVIDSTTESFVFELTGSTEKLNAFINLMEPLGLADA